ncbi:hypothetical protein HAX54_043103, partial [Datura stramonium]|nr:hypothetical protein [Datura stramonium]
APRCRSLPPSGRDKSCIGASAGQWWGQSYDGGANLGEALSPKGVSVRLALGKSHIGLGKSHIGWGEG